MPFASSLSIVVRESKSTGRGGGGGVKILKLQVLFKRRGFPYWITLKMEGNMFTLCLFVSINLDLINLLFFLQKERYLSFHFNF